MSGGVYWCPEPECEWFWREVRRPVGEGEEFERRLARRAAVRDEAIAEHRYLIHGPRPEHPEARPHTAR